MNKILKSAMCVGLCGTMAFAVACNKDGGGKNGHKYDPESRELFLALGATDGNYNPYFYTSQNDGQVVSMTQASLITTKSYKNPTTG